MTSPTAEHDSLIGLLGEARADILDLLRREGALGAPAIADELGISAVAVRKHLARLEEDGFVDATVAEASGRGRPGKRYALTPRARELFPQRYAAVARELIDFIGDEHGRAGMRTFLKWRLEKQAAGYADVVTADDLEGRVEQLAEALSQAGFLATSVAADGTFELRQQHCAIQDLAADHPELCAYEAAAFRRVLGHEVTVSRKGTIAAGDDACVCTVQPRAGSLPLIAD